ncbi:MAG: dihydroorotase family protein [Treponema sp.]|nr:dihydroorotase family protein [Treponema sp.]
MQYDFILKNGNLVTPNDTYIADIAVKDGKIAFTGKIGACDTACDLFDASSLHVLPGVIDAHVHFRDPGLTEKEDFQTGSIAAAFGGITMIADMPNTIPATSTADYFNDKISIAKEKSYIDFALFALLTNENIEEMENLKKAGALGFKVFYGTSTGDIACPSHPVLVQQLKMASSLGMRTGFHCETNDINSSFTGIAKKETDSPDGFWLDYARPVISESQAISNVIRCAAQTGADVHIHHLTSCEGVFLVSEAKEKGIKVTSETCPHYLLFDNEVTHKVYPPIRDNSHRLELWEAVKNGTIDMIASDHAPHTSAEKSLPLWEMPAGLCGVETLVPIFLNEVNRGNLSINDFVRLTSESPAKIWNIFPRKGNLLPGADADFTLVDLKKKHVIDAERLHSKSGTSPFDGMQVQGAVTATIVRGKFIMREGELTGDRGYGIMIKPDIPV